jgi:hypothetical protein
LPSSFWTQALLREYCVVSFYLRRRTEGMRRSVGQLHRTGLIVTSGIRGVHGGDLVGQRLDQIHIARAWRP